MKILWFSIVFFASCTKKDSKEIWVYTSLYKDTIADLSPKLEADFPGVKINWYQAGSEDIAAKVNSEILANNLQVDVLISSDRFWYEDLAKSQKLHSYKSNNAQDVGDNLRHKDGFYTTLSIPVMVLCYNNEVISVQEAPKTFKEMGEQRWSKKFTTGSALASGTNFTTVAMLQQAYGWDYFKNLRKNETIAQGGNSAVLRRIQSKERPIGWVLLEDVLRFQGKDDRLKVVYPEDGVVLQSNVLAITKKDGTREIAEKFADWMFSEKGQTAMTQSFMYSPMTKYAPPKGAPELAKLVEKSFPWNQEILQKISDEREQIKTQYAKIMFE